MSFVRDGAQEVREDVLEVVEQHFPSVLLGILGNQPQDDGRLGGNVLNDLWQHLCCCLLDADKNKKIQFGKCI